MPDVVQSTRESLREEDVQGLKYFRKLWPLFERLHEVGCGRDKAGNRELFMDQYCALVLLFLFNPCLRSLRALQQASELKNVQRKLRSGRASLGSLSEATDVFEPVDSKYAVFVQLADLFAGSLNRVFNEPASGHFKEGFARWFLERIGYVIGSEAPSDSVMHFILGEGSSGPSWSTARALSATINPLIAQRTICGGLTMRVPGCRGGRCITPGSGTSTMNPTTT